MPRRGQLAAEGMAQDQLLQRHAERMREHRPAQAADRARRDLEQPDAAIVNPELGVHRPVRKTGGAAGALDFARGSTLYARRQLRGGDEDRLLEIRAVERIGLVEQREHPQAAVHQQPFERVLAARNEAFDHQSEPRGVAVGLMLDPPDLGHSADQRGSGVGADHAPARREAARLDHRGKLERAKPRRVGARGEMPEPRVRHAAALEQ
jgi:hypothetical protein